MSDGPAWLTQVLTELSPGEMVTLAHELDTVVPVSLSQQDFQQSQRDGSGRLHSVSTGSDATSPYRSQQHLGMGQGEGSSAPIMERPRQRGENGLAGLERTSWFCTRGIGLSGASLC